jgi:hypothetical protein
MLQADCFYYIGAASGPTVFPIVLNVPEDSSIPFLPEFPEDETRE